LAGDAAVVGAVAPPAGLRLSATLTLPDDDTVSILVCAGFSGVADVGAMACEGVKPVACATSETCCFRFNCCMNTPDKNISARGKPPIQDL
jgi:hypothetical protein